MQLGELAGVLVALALILVLISLGSAGFWESLVRPFLQMTGATLHAFGWPIVAGVGLWLAYLFLRRLRRF